MVVFVVYVFWIECALLLYLRTVTASLASWFYFQPEPRYMHSEVLIFEARETVQAHVGSLLALACLVPLLTPVRIVARTILSSTFTARWYAYPP